VNVTIAAPAQPLLDSRPNWLYPIQPPFQDVFWRSIWANLGRPSLGMALFLMGFHGLFFLPLVFPTTYDSARSGVQRYYVLAYLLICCGAWLETVASGMWLLKRRQFWAAFAVLSLSVMTIQGRLDGEGIVIIVTRIVPFVWLLLVPAVGMHARNWPWLWLSLFAQAVVGVPYALHAFFIEGATSRTAIHAMEGQNFLALCLYMAPFVVLMLPVLRSNSLVLGAFSLFGIQVLQALFSAKRIVWFLIPVMILMLAYAKFRSGQSQMFLRRLFLGTLTALLLLPLLTLVVDSSMLQRLFPTIEQGYEGLMGRMLEKGSVSDTIRENERWDEASESMATMNGADWIIGKGVGAKWVCWKFGKLGVDSDRFMIHNTWLNSFYWGGVFLFLVLAMPLVWTLRVFLRSTSTAGICCASVVLLAYIKFPAYLITTPTHEWIMFCLALGACVCHESVLPPRNVKTDYGPRMY
jgi:hypothetical protein